MVPYKTYPHPTESLADRRRRRRLLRRQRWRGRWLSLFALSSVMMLSWIVWSNSDSNRSSLSVSGVKESAQALLQTPKQLPGSATAAPPRLAGQSTTLNYEDWVTLLKEEADTVANQQLTNLNILAGDSISLWFPQNLLPSQQPWLNQGISGETTEGLQKRLDDWQALKPRRIFLMIGINDLLKGKQLEVVIQTNRTMVEQLRATYPEAEIIIQSILPHSGDRATWEGKDKLKAIDLETIQAINQELEAIAQEHAAQYLNLYPLFSDEKGFLRLDLTTDGLHLNPQGYLVWSTALKIFEQQQDSQSQSNFQSQSDVKSTDSANSAAIAKASFTNFSTANTTTNPGKSTDKSR